MIAVGGTATAAERVSDALIGGGVALVMTVLLFPAAPVALISDARRMLFAELRDTLGGLTVNDREPTWALAAGERVQSRLAALQRACGDAREVARIAPRRWPDRDWVRREGERSVSVDLLAATVVSLAHAATAEPASAATIRPAVSELASAFAAKAEGQDDKAASHARRAKRLVADSKRTDLVTRLTEMAATDVAAR